MLPEAGDEEDAKALRRATYSGQAFGDEEFVEALREQRENARASRHHTSVLPSEGALAFAAY